MSRADRVRSVMVEFHRFGDENGIFSGSYIRTAGFDEPARQITVGLSHEDFLDQLNTLRYSGGWTPDEIERAKATLAGEAAKMLAALPEAADDELLQLDLVAGAAELWAFPFETFTATSPRVVLTRRIRGRFGAHASWPAEPRVLFAYAAVSTDLPRTLVDQHIEALKAALRPWAGGGEPDEKLLVCRELYSVNDLVAARLNQAGNDQAFTHIHLLAHGQVLPSRKVRKEWGLRLGTPKSKPVHPREVAEALAPRGGLPVVITIASCDSANQADPAVPSYSVAQELHRREVPVVLASQLPLTMAGSVLLAEHFYPPLLRGVDVRHALHDVRTALQKSGGAGQDWLSLVAYVRLPETYDEHLMEVGLRSEFALLRAARNRADQVIRDADLGKLQEIAALVGTCRQSLSERLTRLERDTTGLRQECQGLIASTHKRVAELLFRGDGKASLDAQRQELAAALEHYRGAFESNIHAHWPGVQKLSLEAVLSGTFSRPADWDTVFRAAELSAARDPWALGTLAELYLLAPIGGRAPDSNAARQTIVQFRRGADANAIESAQLQLRRYVDWWTPANGFATNLGSAAQPLVDLLT